MADVTHSFPGPDAERVVIGQGANALGFEYSPTGVTARIVLGGTPTTFVLEHREFVAFGAALDFLFALSRSRAMREDETP